MTFLDKIGTSLDKGIKTVSSASREFLETSRLRNELAETEAAIEARYGALGKKVFEALNKGNLQEESLAQNAEEIRSLFKKTNELGSAISQIEAASLKRSQGFDPVKCGQCAGTNKAGDKFCGLCGAPLVAPAVGTQAVCPSCTAPLKAGATFCNRCGAKLA